MLFLRKTEENRRKIETKIEENKEFLEKILILLKSTIINASFLQTFLTKVF